MVLLLWHDGHQQTTGFQPHISWLISRAYSTILGIKPCFYDADGMITFLKGLFTPPPESGLIGTSICGSYI
jgi:hypothetical protein